ncbi:phage tail protein [Clostridium botulinum]|uniref:phage tail protein n=1 Tax=Clostridium botulinum TaxID=1491 RepID=UPI001FAFA8FA|nr:phage tail protein [Clostridium botulinum]
MAEQFYTILTKLGKAKIANSAALGSKVDFVKLKIGDGGGKYYNPTENQDELINQVWEGNIGSVKIDKENSNWVIVETVIPSDVGGFFIREAGIYDDEDNLIAISKLAETYKPLASEGSSKDLIIRVILEVSNAENVTLKIDPTVILATKKDVQVLESNINKKIDDINSSLKDIANNKASKAELEELKKTVSNIDLSATKVNLTAINGMSAKNVQTGMQELFTFASNGKSAIAGKVGNVTGSNTHTEIADRLQTDKNTAASNLNNKGVSSNGNEALASLVSKIANISIQGMGGKKFVNGKIEVTSASSDSSFAPQISFSVGIQIEYFVLYHVPYKGSSKSIQIILPGLKIYMNSNDSNAFHATYSGEYGYGHIADAFEDKFITTINPNWESSVITNGTLYYFVIGQ